jgi:rare lipoprotein A (peptidoglycan hydrolase)
MHDQTRAISTFVYSGGIESLHLGVKTFSSLALLLFSLVTPGRSPVENQASIHAIAPARTAAAIPLMVASWYGGKFQGRLTANGEHFDKAKLTAAHKTLPLGSLVRLTVPSTGRSVVVRINDRGPWLKGRDFDVSEAAATALGIHKNGIAALQATVLSKDASL